MTYLNFIIQQYPKRLRRLANHWLYFFNPKTKNPTPSKTFSEWIIDLMLFSLDALCVPEIYMAINQISKCNTRRLTEEEIFIAKEIFGNTLNTDVIRVDSHALLGTKRLALAYVSFNLINYRTDIPLHVFVHELVHVWQFQNLGSIYIGRALQAQISRDKYDYGGPENLFKQMILGKKLLDFNFEQQAEIVEDFYVLGNMPTWQRPIDLSVYEYYKQDLYV